MRREWPAPALRASANQTGLEPAWLACARPRGPALFPWKLAGALEVLAGPVAVAPDLQLRAGVQKPAPVQSRSASTTVAASVMRFQGLTDGGRAIYSPTPRRSALAWLRGHRRKTVSNSGGAR